MTHENNNSYLHIQNILSGRAPGLSTIGIFVDYKMNNFVPKWMKLYYFNWGFWMYWIIKNKFRTMLSPPPSVRPTMTWSYSINNNNNKILINSVSQVTSQLQSINHPGKGVRKTTATCNDILKEHLGESRSYWAVSAAGHTDIKATTARRLACLLSATKVAESLVWSPLATWQPTGHTATTTLPTRHGMSGTNTSWHFAVCVLWETNGLALIHETLSIFSTYCRFTPCYLSRA